MVKTPDPTPIPRLQTTIQHWNESRIIYLEDMVEELIQQNIYLQDKINFLLNNPYERANMNPLMVLNKE
jgi:hypothetical protein